MADKFHSDTQEKIETITYTPSVALTNDLEAETNTITVTSEASGVGNADYSKALTLSKPSDARIIVERIAARLQVTIDSMTAGHLHCRVYVDQQDADHRLFDEDWDSSGDKPDAVDTHSGALSTIFDLLKDGASHTFYFFFWVDSGNAVISAVQLWEGVGTCSTGGCAALAIIHQGFMSISASIGRYGTGTINAARLAFSGDNHGYISVSGGSTNGVAGLAVVENPDIYLRASVATDIILMTYLLATLRRVQ